MAPPPSPHARDVRPAALPPRERTVGQLVAETVRLYGERDRFFRCLAVGLPAACLAVLTPHLSRAAALVLAPTLYGALLSAAFVAASAIALDRRPGGRRLALAWFFGWVVFAPVPFLVLAFVLLAYTGESVATTFVVTAGMFGAMAAYGTLTRRSLAGVGQFPEHVWWGTVGHDPAGVAVGVGVGLVVGLVGVVGGFVTQPESEDLADPGALIGFVVGKSLAGPVAGDEDTASADA